MSATPSSSATRARRIERSASARHVEHSLAKRASARHVAIPEPLRSNDAIHLAVAVRLGADPVLTYDAELARAAELLGLQVAMPA